MTHLMKKLNHSRNPPCSYSISYNEPGHLSTKAVTRLSFSFCTPQLAPRFPKEKCHKLYILQRKVFNTGLSSHTKRKFHHQGCVHQLPWMWQQELFVNRSKISKGKGSCTSLLWLFLSHLNWKQKPKHFLFPPKDVSIHGPVIYPFLRNPCNQSNNSFENVSTHLTFSREIPYWTLREAPN